MVSIELDNWIFVASILGAFAGMIIRIVNQGKTERKQIENPTPEPEEKMTIAAALDLVKDVLGKFASSLLSTYLGEPLIKEAQKKELLASETIPGITNKALQDIAQVMSDLQLEINLMKQDLLEQVNNLTFNNGKKIEKEIAKDQNIEIDNK